MLLYWSDDWQQRTMHTHGKWAKNNQKWLTIIKSNIDIRVLHDLKLCSMRIQRHLRHLCSDVAYKQCSIVVLFPMPTRQCLQCVMLQVDRSQRWWIWRLQLQDAAFAVVRLIYLNLYTLQAHNQKFITITSYILHLHQWDQQCFTLQNQISLGNFTKKTKADQMSLLHGEIFQ